MSAMDRIAPGPYGSRNPLALHFHPRERARYLGLGEDAATLRRLADRARAQMAQEFPEIAFSVLPDVEGRDQ